MRKWKKFIGVALACCMMLAVMTTAEAKNGNVKQDLEYKNIKVTLNGQALDLRDVKGNSVEPFMFNGTNYLPVRALSEALGLDVKWDGKTNTVKIVNGSAKNSSVDKMFFYDTLCYNFSEELFLFNNMLVVPSVFQTSTSRNGENLTTINKLKAEEKGIDDLYNNLKSSNQITENDVDFVSAHDRLAKIAISDLQVLSGYPSQAEINALQGAAQQNSLDAMKYQGKTRTAVISAYGDYAYVK